MSIKIACDKANEICDKNQYKEASFWEKVKLNIHLIYCRLCRKYSTRNVKLSKAIKNKKVHTLPKDQKQVLKEQLQREMSK